ncbi:GlxA family transcriptional regulator [Nitratireductor sp. XY-223]|uniref:GlxA family transcriptional regulator n=1 Tax=Nitratireductor sp. XY-223 TaxID=2561926 RepID=UPI00145A3D9E|nr:GlxA family transcriptional regulator [Nitratireductor sp. XY-223]
MDISTTRNKPFRVGFLLIDGFALMSYSAAVEPLRAANLLADRELYAVEHLPVVGGQSVASSGAIVKATAHLGERVDFDLLLVVAGGDPMRFFEPRVFQWLRHLSRRGVLIGGVSGGPVILARAGIMDGRRMTVHWEHAPALAEFEPSLLLERNIYVIDRDRLTCAGATAALDMMHALITAHHGADFATRVSDWFVHTEIRPAGWPQRAGPVQRYGTSSPLVLQAIELMENHMADPLALDQIAQLVGLSARQLNRLFRSQLGRSTMGFYRDLRLDMADNLLRQSALGVTEIALASGFANSAHFSDSYRRRFGRAPSAGRRPEGSRAL